METYPLDIDPGQVVRWIREECDAAPASFRVTGRISREVREIPIRRETRLGDEEREDLSEVATVATLEIAPVHAHDGWLLSVVVEDEAGPRANGTASAGEQQIDVGAFYKEFIRPGRGTANVIAEVEGEEGRAHITRLLDAIESNRHAPTRARDSAPRAR
jgi:hypothetical protein